MYANKEVRKNKQAPMSALPTIPVTASDMKKDRDVKWQISITTCGSEKYGQLTPPVSRLVYVMKLNCNFQRSEGSMVNVHRYMYFLEEHNMKTLIIK